MRPVLPGVQVPAAWADVAETTSTAATDRDANPATRRDRRGAVGVMGILSRGSETRSDTVNIWFVPAARQKRKGGGTGTVQCAMCNDGAGAPPSQEETRPRSS